MEEYVEKKERYWKKYNGKAENISRRNWSLRGWWETKETTGKERKYGPVHLRQTRYYEEGGEPVYQAMLFLTNNLTHKRFYEYDEVAISFPAIRKASQTWQIKNATQPPSKIFL